MVGYQCGAAGLPAAGAVCTLRAVQRVAPGKCEATFTRCEDRRSPWVEPIRPARYKPANLRG